MAYDLFISYSRLDNRRGQVAALKTQIEASFRAFAGRELRVFFDTQDIAGMDDFRHKIQRSLRDSQVFLAVLSPHYLTSPYCRWEWEDYVRYEAMRQCLGEGVAPVFFVTLPDAADPNNEPAIAHWLDEIQRRQTFDLRPWYEAGEQALQQEHIRQTLEQLHTSVRKRLDRSEQARQSPNNLLKHNPAFVGRVKELTALREALTRNKLGVLGARDVQVPSRATVQGLGGMGKTELALAYAHAFAWDYPGGRWQIPCEHLDDLRVALLHLANVRALNFTFTEDEKKDLTRSFERVLWELNRRERCLLILDNVSGPNLLHPDYVDRIPRNGRVDLIATTRLAPRAIPGSAMEQSFIAVDELPEEDALALMRSHQPEGRFVNQQEDDEARTIIRLLRGFTLAVETAAIYLGRSAAQDSGRRFRERLTPALLQESEIAATDPTVAVRHRVRSMEETLAFTLQILSPEALHLLAIASLLPADQIALPWLMTAGAARFPALAVRPAEPNSTVRQAEESLLGHRVLQSAEVVDEYGRLLVVRMHRLVQEVVKKILPEDFSKLDDALQDMAVKRGERAVRTWVDGRFRWEVEPLRAAAMMWLMGGAIAGVNLASSISVPLLELGRWPQAEQLLRTSLEMQERLRGLRSPEISPLLNNLAMVLHATNRLVEAEELYRRSIEITERIPGGNGSDFAVLLSNLANLLRDANRLQEAETLIRKALRIEEAQPGAPHPRAAAMLNSLATLLELTGRRGQAEPFVRRALKIHELHHGPNHPYVATDLGNLATLLFHSDRLTEAETLFRRQLTILEVLEPDHPSTASALINLSELLRTTNRVGEAEACVHRAVAINKKCYGPDHPKVARALNAQGRCLLAANRLVDAETAYRGSLKIAESNFGPMHPHVASVLTGLASAVYRQGRQDEAIGLLRRNLTVLARFGRSVGNDHPDLHRAINAYGGVMEATGRTKVEIMAEIRSALTGGP